MPPRLLVLFLLPVALAAQSQLPFEVIALARVKDRMRASLDRAPNYTCFQTIHRARLTKKARRRLERKLIDSRRRSINLNLPVSSTDTLEIEVAYVAGRELYSWPGADGFEERSLGELVGFGSLSTGSFAVTAHNVFLTDAARFNFRGREVIEGKSLLRYDFQVSLFQSGFTLRDSRQEIEVPYKGSCWVDPETFDLVRLETEAVDIPPELEISKAITRVDYAPVTLDGNVFLLPQSARDATSFWSGAENHNRTEFTRCRRFGASSTISFDDAPPEAEPEADWRDVSMPPGVSLSIRLSTEISSANSKVGHRLEGTLELDAKYKGRVLFPKGAAVLGRLRRLEHYDENGPFYLVGIEISEVRFDGTRARFLAFMERFIPVPGIVFAGPSSRTGARSTALPLGRVPSRLQTKQTETFTDLELPGVDVVPVQGSRFRIPPGFRMTWLTMASQ